jgi:hypothetical protein
MDVIKLATPQQPSSYSPPSVEGAEDKDDRGSFKSSQASFDVDFLTWALFRVNLNLDTIF